MVSPLTVFGQDPGRPYNVGALHLGPWDAPHHLAFRSALRRLGFIEGYNLSLDKEGDGLRREQFDEHAVALVTSNVTVIHCSGMQASVPHNGQQQHSQFLALPTTCLVLAWCAPLPILRAIRPGSASLLANWMASGKSCERALNPPQMWASNFPQFSPVG
jgi:hypothetical protein